MVYLELFLTFLKIGAFTFGGGYAMLPLIQEEVMRHGWLAESELIDFVAISESTPGPFAINISTFVGIKIGGLPGALCSTFGVVLPSFVIIFIVAGFFEKFKSNRGVKGCMSGLKPAVVGLIASALVTMVPAVFFPQGYTFAVFQSPLFYMSVIICIISAVMVFKKINPIIVICICAVLGIGGGYAFSLP